ncbi:MAG: DEAD/DEAH box helicase, partial [Bacteroidia bacterium]|nr:DUF1998 domain-containing protein [Bacteroidia bacterium]MDW8157279.1 DEAD/DEAH box helicase [Bacteroidia bacterium]
HSPNILIYESAEGSAGILCRLLENSQLIPAILQKAYQICFCDEKGNELPTPLIPATYNDLLSYYNQRFHHQIDRNLIRDSLSLLHQAKLQILTQPAFSQYDEHYQSLLRVINSNSNSNTQLEKKLIEYLYSNGLKLPNFARYKVLNCNVESDFFYEPNVCIFCKGPDFQEHDLKISTSMLKKKGYQVLVWNYQESLEDFVAQRADVFIKVK